MEASAVVAVAFGVMVVVRSRRSGGSVGSGSSASGGFAVAAAMAVTVIRTPVTNSNGVSERTNTMHTAYSTNMYVNKTDIKTNLTEAWLGACGAYGHALGVFWRCSGPALECPGPLILHDLLGSFKRHVRRSALGVL